MKSTLVGTSLAVGIGFVSFSSACSSNDTAPGSTDSGAQDSATSADGGNASDGGSTSDGGTRDGGSDGGAADSGGNDSATNDGGGGAGNATIAVNSQKSCALTPAGDAYCWGAGPLGDGTTNSSNTPVKVTGGMKFSGIYGGGGSSARMCALTTAGAAYCWSLGANSPTAVAAGSTFKSLGVGNGFTCGLGTSGVVSCWGDTSSNGSGGLGLGTVDQNAHLTPTPVVGNHTFTTLVTGLNHSCAIETSGDMYCWGSNVNGESGGSIANGTNPAPTKVPGGLTFTAVAAAWSHTCAVATGGDLYCWGENGNGSVGAQQSSNNVTSPLMLGGGLKFAAVSAGTTWSCAVTLAGAGYCWGQGQNAGTLGIGGNSAVAIRVPTAVSGAQTFSNAIASDAHTTGYHSCAITKTGAAYCWGQEVFGEDGDGMAQSNLLVPTAVVGGLTFAAP